MQTWHMSSVSKRPWEKPFASFLSFQMNHFDLYSFCAMMPKSQVWMKDGKIHKISRAENYKKMEKNQEKIQYKKYLLDVEIATLTKCSFLCFYLSQTFIILPLVLSDLWFVVSILFLVFLLYGLSSYSYQDSL